MLDQNGVRSILDRHKRLTAIVRSGRAASHSLNNATRARKISGDSGKIASGSPFPSVCHQISACRGNFRFLIFFQCIGFWQRCSKLRKEYLPAT